MLNRIYNIEYNLNEKDCYLFKIWMLTQFRKIIYLIFLFIVIFTSYENLISGDLNKIIITIISYLILCLIYVFIIKILKKSRLLFLFEQKKDFNLKMRLKVSDNRIEVFDHGLAIEYTWKEIKKIVVIENYIYLMMSSIKGIIIPIEKIEDKEFIDFLKVKSNHT